MAGMIPGIMVCGSQMLYCFYKAKRDPENCDGNYHPKFNLHNFLMAAKDAIPAMIMPAIIIGERCQAYSPQQKQVLLPVYMAF